MAVTEKMDAFCSSDSQRSVVLDTRYIKIKAKQRSGKAVRWEEIGLAEKCVIRYVQMESFTGPQDERISRLWPYKDSEGIILLRTKIIERTDLGDSRIPAILPSSGMLSLGVST